MEKPAGVSCATKALSRKRATVLRPARRPSDGMATPVIAAPAFGPAIVPTPANPSAKAEAETGASDPAARLVRRLRTDPVFFCREVLGVNVWAKQAEVLLALRDHDRIAVRSGHGTGKSFVAAAAALWFLYAFYPAKVVTTAPTAAQVRLILWSELRRLFWAARIPLGGTALEERLKVAEDAFAVGLATDEAERFQGFHAESVLVVLDEAPGVRPEIWRAAETLLTGRRGKMLAIGNPTRPDGPFRDCFRPGAGWRTVAISCLDSPNMAAPSGTVPYPRLVTPGWVESRRREWGETSSTYRSRVLGEFPDDDRSLVVPGEWLRLAAEGVVPERSGPMRLGVDVARHGPDWTVFAVRDDRAVRHIEARQGLSTMETAGRARRLMEEWDVAAHRVFIDDTGVGAGVTDRLRETGFAVTAVIGAARSSDPQRFLNARAEGYWRLREALSPDREGGALRLPGDAGELLRELGAVTYAFSSTGALKVTDKMELRGLRAGRPDHADALALPFAREAAAGEEVSVLDPNVAIF